MSPRRVTMHLSTPSASPNSHPSAGAMVVTEATGSTSSPLTGSAQWPNSRLPSTICRCSIRESRHDWSARSRARNSAVSGCDTGRWLVETASGSLNEIDLDAMTQTRARDLDRSHGRDVAPRRRRTMNTCDEVKVACLLADVDADLVIRRTRQRQVPPEVVLEGFRRPTGTRSTCSRTRTRCQVAPSHSHGAWVCRPARVRPGEGLGGRPAHPAPHRRPL